MRAFTEIAVADTVVGGTMIADTVRRAAGGDQRAWCELVDRYGGMLRSIARTFRLSTADAEDAGQVTWALLVQHVGRVRSRTNRRVAGLHDAPGMHAAVHQEPAGDIGPGD